ncbi:hypothetical protein [Halorussus sp. AFM4]|uniref:hypothetical protein n=1 Tax=Halorussus sp. AFM4 TaxID=3421651 RepID=UPI003EBC4CCF
MAERIDSSDGLLWFLRENIHPQDLTVTVLLTVSGGYLFYLYYGVVSVIVPVVLFTVITTEVGLWYVRNFDIGPWARSSDLYPQKEEEHTPLSEQVKGDWRMIVGLAGAISSWLVLLGIMSMTPGSSPSNSSLREQVLLETSLAGRAFVVLLVFLVSVHLLLSGTTVKEEPSSFEGC